MSPTGRRSRGEWNGRHGRSQGIASQTFQGGQVIAPNHALAVHRKPRVHPAEQGLLELLRQPLGLDQPLQHQAPEDLLHNLWEVVAALVDSYRQLGRNDSALALLNRAAQDSGMAVQARRQSGSC